MAIYNLTLILLLTLANNLFAIEAPQSLSIQELHLNDVQKARIEKDLPITDVFFDQTPNLWFVGRRSLWFWQVHQSRLAQISLDSKLAEGESLRFIGALGSDLWAMSDRQAYRISFGPLKINPISAEAAAQSFGLQKIDKTLYWIRADGVYQALVDNNKVKKVYPLDLPTEARSPQLLHQRLWYIQEQDLVSVDLMTNKPGNKFHTRNPLLQFIALDDALFVHTPYTLLQLNDRAQIAQTIPVAGKRKLVLMELKSDRHLFVFSDQFMELKMPLTQKSFYSQVSIGRVEKAQLLRSRESLVAMILDHKIRLFQLEGDWASCKTGTCQVGRPVTK